VTAFEGRPETIGELLDGAIRRYLQLWWPFTIVLGMIGVVDYAVGLLAVPTPHRSIFADIFDMLGRHALPGSSVDVKSLLGPGLLLGTCCQMFAIVLMMTVGFSLAASASESDAPVVPEALSQGFRRFVPALAATLVQLAATLVVIVIALFVVGATMVALIRVAPLLALVPAIVVIVAAFVLFVMGQFAWYEGMLAVTLDGCGPLTAAWRGWRLAFCVPYVKRSLLVGFVLILLDAVVVLLGDGLGDLVDLIPHAAMFGYLPQVVMNIPVQGVELVFVLSYTRDLARRFDTPTSAVALA